MVLLCGIDECGIRRVRWVFYCWCDAYSKMRRLAVGGLFEQYVVWLMIRRGENYSRIAAPLDGFPFRWGMSMYSIPLKRGSGALLITEPL